jgi:hypothetical protein
MKPAKSINESIQLSAPPSSSSSSASGSGSVTPREFQNFRTDIIKKIDANDQLTRVLANSVNELAIELKPIAEYVSYLQDKEKEQRQAKYDFRKIIITAVIGMLATVGVTAIVSIMNFLKP